MNREGVLASLGIPLWQARPGVAFPGGPAMEARHAAPEDKALAAAICLHADALDAGQAELLERIMKAACELRAGLKVVIARLDEPTPAGALALRLDDGALPSLGSMLHDPTLKRPVWLALKEALARLD